MCDNNLAEMSPFAREREKAKREGWLQSPCEMSNYMNRCLVIVGIKPISKVCFDSENGFSFETDGVALAFSCVVAQQIERIMGCHVWFQEIVGEPEGVLSEAEARAFEAEMAEGF